MKRRTSDPALLKQYAATHNRCAACWVPWGGSLVWRSGRLQVHHLINGAGRADVSPNLLALCPECHMCITHGPQIYATFRAAGLTKEMCLRLKRDELSDEWCEQTVLRLWGRKSLPELPGLPGVFVRERERWA